MAFKIGVRDQKEIEAKLEVLKTSRGEVEDAIASYNDAVTQARAELLERVEQYNEVAEGLRSYITDIRDAKQEEFHNKSDKWQEGDRASAVSDWIDSIDTMIDAIEDAQEPDEVDELEISAIIDGEDDIAEQFDAMDKEPQE